MFQSIGTSSRHWTSLGPIKRRTCKGICNGCLIQLKDTPHIFKNVQDLMKELFQIIERCLVIGTGEYFIQFYMFSAQNRRNFWCSEALFQTSIWRLNVLLFYFFIYKFNYHFIVLWLYCVDFKASILGKGDQCSAASALFSAPYSFASFNFFSKSHEEMSCKRLKTAT